MPNTDSGRTPKVTVIVPVYNVADHVAACIESIGAQSWHDFEVIVVDDGATDGSGDIARRAAGDDARFRFIHQDNGGLSAARNTGLDHARGDYICFVDSDDRVAPGYLERLLSTLEETGADWVACGVLFCHADGRTQPHSAIHGVPKLEQGAAPRRYDFDDWQEIARHFPSAWNKIYRRALVGDLRFDEGLLYEDHVFYYRYAARCDHMVHLPEPLYLNTQGRDGQITRDGSDRVFEQFSVLEGMRDIIKGSETKTGGQAALADITTRLTFERSMAIRDRDRRAKFLAQARTVLGDTASDRLGVPAYWMDLLDGLVPVSVIIPSDGNIAALHTTLTSLANQNLREVEILVALDAAATDQRDAVLACAAQTEAVSVLTSTGAGTGVAATRNRGLDAARGQAVVFLDAGDRLPPQALISWHNRLFKAGGDGADCGFAGFLMGGVAHSGLHDRAALSVGFDDEGGFEPTPQDGVYIHPHPSAKIYRRAFLLDHGLRFPPEPLSSWYMLMAALSQAQRAVYLTGPAARISNQPEHRRLWRHPDTLAALLGALERLETVSAGNQTRLFVRAVWEKINFADFPDAPSRELFQSAARQHVAGLQDAGATLDPFIGDYLRHLLGLPDART